MSRALVSGLAVVVVSIALSVAPVVAGTPSETGTYGVHILLDNPEYPGAICASETGTDLIDKITVRRPIIFATSGVASQRVGEVTTIESKVSTASDDTYTLLDASPLRKATATPNHNAMFPRWSHAIVPTELTYRVVVTDYWYGPDGTTPVGTAVQIGAYYDHQLAATGDAGGHSITPNDCESSEGERAGGVRSVSIPDGLVGDPPGHSDHYGAHDLIDDQEYPETRCVYSSTGHLALKTMTIRAPIVYASDRVGTSGRQTVGWRYRIQYNDVSFNSSADWHDLSTSSVVKASATGSYNAQWSGRTYSLTHATAHVFYRIVIDMFWYWPSASHQDGKAVHVGQVTDVVLGTDLGNNPGYCGATGG